MIAVDRPQITTRESELLMWVTGLGEDVSVATQRIEASNVFSGHGDDHEALVAVLERYPIRTVIVRLSMLSVSFAPPTRAEKAKL